VPSRDCAGNRRQVVHFHQDFLADVADGLRLLAARFQVRDPFRREGSPPRLRRYAAMAIQREGPRGRSLRRWRRRPCRSIDRGPPDLRPSAQPAARSVHSAAYRKPLSRTMLAEDFGRSRAFEPLLFLRVFRKVHRPKPAQYVMSLDCGRRPMSADDQRPLRKSPSRPVSMIFAFQCQFSAGVGRSPTHWRVR